MVGVAGLMFNYRGRREVLLTKIMSIINNGKKNKNKDILHCLLVDLLQVTENTRKKQLWQTMWHFHPPLKHVFSYVDIP